MKQYISNDHKTNTRWRRVVSLPFREYNLRLLCRRSFEIAQFGIRKVGTAAGPNGCSGGTHRHSRKTDRTIGRNLAKIIINRENVATVRAARLIEYLIDSVLNLCVCSQLWQTSRSEIRLAAVEFGSLIAQACSALDGCLVYRLSTRSFFPSDSIENGMTERTHRFFASCMVIYSYKKMRRRRFWQVHPWLMHSAFFNSSCLSFFHVRNKEFTKGQNTFNFPNAKKGKAEKIVAERLGARHTIICK